MRLSYHSLQVSAAAQPIAQGRAVNSFRVLTHPEPLCQEQLSICGLSFHDKSIASLKDYRISNLSYWLLINESEKTRNSRGSFGLRCYLSCINWVWAFCPTIVLSASNKYFIVMLTEKYETITFKSKMFMYLHTFIILWCLTLRNPLSSSGDKLCSEEDCFPGTGVYRRHGYIYSALAGYVLKKNEGEKVRIVAEHVEKRLGVGLRSSSTQSAWVLRNVCESEWVCATKMKDRRPQTSGGMLS